MRTVFRHPFTGEFGYRHNHRCGWCERGIQHSVAEHTAAIAAYQRHVARLHVCLQHAVEFEMSTCQSGCKRFRCEVCGTVATLHNKIYGCRHPNAH